MKGFNEWVENFTESEEYKDDFFLWSVMAKSAFKAGMKEAAKCKMMKQPTRHLHKYSVLNFRGDYELRLQPKLPQRFTKEQVHR